MNLCDLKTIKGIMKTFGLEFKKEFGQNFLTNKMVVETIADECCLYQSKTILEIGPGIGTLTRELCERYPRVISYEIDKTLIPVHAFTLGEYGNVTVINEDIMKVDLKEALAPYLDGGVSVCANLPYYITTPILMMLLESRIKFDYITIMIQAEVADRLCAKAGNKAYGAITAVLNYYATAEKLFVVRSDRFVPEPKVDSTVIRIKLHKEKPIKPLDEATLFRTIRAAFEQRRKTLPNALSAVFTELSKDEITAIITEKCGLAADIRGERLDIATFAALSDELYKAISK